MSFHALPVSQSSENPKQSETVRKYPIGAAPLAPEAALDMSELRQQERNP